MPEVTDSSNPRQKAIYDQMAVSARCDCYCDHPSSSGRCTTRRDGPGNWGVADPTHFPGQVAICSACRAECACHKGERINADAADEAAIDAVLGT